MPGLLAALVDLAVPAACVGCGHPGVDLCGPCGRPLRAPPRWVSPTPAPPGLPPVAGVADYDGAVRAAIVAYKERAAFALAPPLSAVLSRAVAHALGAAAPDLLARGAVLVPMPSSAAARRARADDPVRRLARLAAAALRRAGFAVEVAGGVFRHTRAVRDSAGLSATDRAANLAGALAADVTARTLPAGRAVVLVDDLMTTGATLAEATRAMAAGGRAPVAAAVVASAVRRHLVRARGLEDRSAAG